MSTTPHLGLPLLAAAQAQKHVTHNEALFALDALVQCAVLDKDLPAPPADPAEGTRYIVGPAATGDWTDQEDLLLLWQDGAWLAIPPRIGFIVYVVDEALFYVFLSGGWAPLTDALVAIQNLARLGIGTAADAANPFAAKLNKALWTARGTGEGGTGDLRCTLNKESAANVLSLLFQTNYSGRLELGLIGDDRLVAKVSPDGASWHEALSADPASGSLDFLSAEANLASAATVDLGAQPTRRIAVTGTTTITSFGNGANKERLLRLADALTLRHNATSLILPGAADIVTVAGDTAIFASDGAGNWRCLDYQRASGKALAAPGATEIAGTTAIGRALLTARSSGLVRSLLSVRQARANRLLSTYVASAPWTARTSAADNSWYGVCWSAELGLFCAVATTGTGNRVMTSPDGITWTARASSADNGWVAVCWSAELGLFCAVAASGA
ncbi:DUF2793 domain-containing protein, partial [Enterovirga sp.]|uniref:DUF2793 domain-containing protein n=1 Tax=Enterovirga sp. TaxID=2026350 RepID=UPI002CACCAEE